MSAQVPITDLISPNQTIFPDLFLKVIGYIFGGVSTTLIDKVTVSSAIIITLSIWILIFLTFGDILSTFGTFRPSIAWTIAILLSVIAANLGFVVNVSAYLFGIFIVFGNFAVILGLCTAFVAFLLVNFGVKGVGGWLIRRRLMNEAMRTKAQTEAEGEKLSGTIKALSTIGDAISKS